MDLNAIRFVLTAPSHPGNIGSAARALKTMGFTGLYLVTPELFPHPQAYERAAGADDVLDNAIVTHTLEEALQGCSIAIAVSARARHLNLPLLTPKTCANLIAQQASDTQIAIVFGRERTGLTNEEFLHCQFHTAIPSNPQYSSLNLAQALQILAYELRDKYLSLSEQGPVETTQPLAKIEDVEHFHKHLEQILTETGFLKTSNMAVLSRLRRLCNRAMLEELEVNMLRGILTQIQRNLK